MDTKNDITKAMELKSLYCLREMIPDNVQGGTEIHGFLLLRDPIRDELISNVDMNFPLANLLSTIIF